MGTPRQLHELPSLRGSGPALGFTPRPRRGRRVAALGAVGMLAVLGLRGAAVSADAPAPTVTTAADDVATRAAAPQAQHEGLDATAPATTPMATVQGLAVHVVSPDAMVVGYHEASLPGALAMTPVGHGLSNDNTTRITLPPDHDGGTDYHVMSSRGRVLPPTSAVDMVLHDDDPVLAPVTGEVTEVRPYALYGQYPDTRIEIRPDDAPDLRVVLIHVDGVQVAAGDRLEVGRTVLATTANRFPFSSHVDRYLNERWPHVHLEVVDPALRLERVAGGPAHLVAPEVGGWLPSPGPLRRAAWRPPEDSRRPTSCPRHRLARRRPTRPSGTAPTRRSTSSSPAGSPRPWARASRPRPSDAC